MLEKLGTFLQTYVALRKESVDRNIWVDKTQYPASVALRKESVDRNWWVEGDRFFYYASLSARRAWIEISILMYHIT